jgi:N-acetylglucosaminyldiphosphoundecaprenol N-acetyl-beta-D-mannosaminyltransferase
LVRPQASADLPNVTALPDDLAREVYCILGLPIDAIDSEAVVRRIELASAGAAPFVISTPNLNFLVASQFDPEFRDCLLLSDLCPADGMPIVWIAKLFGIPIKRRIAGSDIFEALKIERGAARPMKLFLFGGAAGVAAKAAEALNAHRHGLRCVGWCYPGFGTVEEMSRAEFIDQINSSQADFLVASLGAKKGQMWLRRNHDRLRVPIRAHLGATLNFQAGTIKRAPRIMRKLGIEWLWRIKEEPYLWRRYWADGLVLLQLMLTRVLPLSIWMAWLRLRHREQDLAITRVDDHESTVLSLCGFATAPNIDKIIAAFRAAAPRRQVSLDFDRTQAVDARFLGLLLMLTKKFASTGASLRLEGISRRLRRLFRLHGVEFLLSSARVCDGGCGH